jgi:hypothetical protein
VNKTIYAQSNFSSNRVIESQPGLIALVVILFSCNLAIEKSEENVGIPSFVRLMEVALDPFGSPGSVRFPPTRFFSHNLWMSVSRDLISHFIPGSAPLTPDNAVGNGATCFA